MPWANGRGMTTEILRADGPTGLIWRLSMAAVSEDGAFSVFPGLDRNLTVIDGPGFSLKGEGIALDCRPMRPVAFAGDAAIAAIRTNGVASTDFNVMWARSGHRPEVGVHAGRSKIRNRGMLCVFALSETRVNGVMLARYDLLLPETDADVSGPGPVIAVQLVP